jgi:hypothetical protein
MPFTILYYIGSPITSDKPCDHRHLLTSLLHNKWTSAGRRPMMLQGKQKPLDAITHTHTIMRYSTKSRANNKTT